MCPRGVASRMLASPYLPLLQHCWEEHSNLCLLRMWNAPSKHAPLSLLVVCTCTQCILACPLIVIGSCDLLACCTTAQECAQGQGKGSRCNQLFNLRYMSQVTYGILRICRIGFLRISERRSADVREPSAESSLVIRGIIAGYPRNHR